MSTVYYIFKNEVENQELFDSANIIIFLIKDTNDEGELYVKDLTGIKIKYNKKTGIVKPVSSIVSKNVKNFYSHSAFFHLVNPIIDAICLLAKIELLLKLHELNDHEVSSIIRNNHLTPTKDTYINLNQGAVDKTYKQIKHCVKPHIFRRKKKTNIQRAIHALLTKIKIETIRCKNDVDIFFTELRNKLNHVHKSASSSL